MYRIGKEEIKAIEKVIKSKKLFRVKEEEGECDKFEKEWAKKIGVKYALLMSGGGTAALISGLVGLDIGPGDEVLIPSYTFMATATSVLMVGAIPVVVEVDETCTIDPVDVEKKITKNTKCIIPVHMVGFPCNMEKIMEIAKKYNLKVLEDCCQAVGGSFRGKQLGSWGDAGAYSFNYFKIISCGEGGCLVTDDRIIYEKASIFHDSGTAFRPYAKEFSIPIFLGLQLRASEIMGAIMRIQLKRLDKILKDLRKNKRRIMEEMENVSGVEFAPSNDIDGDCGVMIPFRFENEEIAKKFAEISGGYRPIDSKKHVWFDWKPIIEKKVWHKERLNPYNFPENKDLRHTYTKEMYPKSIENLSRTVFIPVNPDWKYKEIKEKIKKLKKAIEESYKNGT
ncbi:MAG: DegT/DnrJ/EryC1/StrS family aminotransferase [Candidatus Omnitrophica bacterium]|nr:DegT/DnrJ/EryC1/StrS family aminotransferase [Candidatus Omnitrophota bacterium]MCM8810076.1 DegT/DnrJ/EryC1/StrS family aminotransferase [Candidatus Omnitrophota bacterium]